MNETNLIEAPGGKQRGTKIELIAALEEAINALELEMERLAPAVKMVESRGEMAVDAAQKDFRRYKRKAKCVSILRAHRHQLRG
jgi:hypothetical protein